MNQYALEIGHIAGLTAAQKRQIVEAWGYMALAAVTMEHTPQSVGALGYSETHTKFVTPFRVPSDLGVTAVGLDIAGKAFAWLAGADSTMTQELSNMERVVVNQGDFVVALCAPGMSVRSELVNMQTYYLPGGHSLQVGLASQTEIDGVYDRPFASADAFVNFGSLTNVDGLVTNGVPLPTVQRPNVPVAGSARGGASRAASTNKATRF